MILPTGHLLAFAATAFVLIVVPGPSVLFVVSRGVALGRRAALLTVLGNAAGEYLQVTLVALGVGALVARSVFVFDVLKLAGALYLVVLGVRAWRARRSLAEVIGATVAPSGTLRMLREGFVVGATNPKSIVFFAAILPQFAEPARGHVPVQLLALGVVFVAIALVSDGAWAFTSGTARAWIARSPRAMQRLGGTGGLVMIGLGLRLAVSGRRD